MRSAWVVGVALAGLPAPARGARVAYVNFEGAELVAGQSDATVNSTSLEGLEGPFPAYGEAVQAAAVLAAVRADFAAYDIAIADERPSVSEYAMVLVGPKEGFGAEGEVLGLAVLDCLDDRPNDVAFAFHGDRDGYNATEQAQTISQELAHAFGLEHVGDAADIMHPVTVDGDPGFTDACLAIEGAPVCVTQHLSFCSDGEQNAHRELLSVLGAPTADTVAPTPTIISPDDGERIAPGDDLIIFAVANDDRGIDHVTLLIDDVASGNRTVPPYEWDAREIPEGTYELVVVAVDDSGNSGESEAVTLVVAHGDPEGETTGCGCRHSSPPAALAMLLIAAGLRRRGRRDKVGT